MDADMEMPSKEESLEAFIGFLVEPILNKYGHGDVCEPPSAAAHEEVAKQVQATVVLYNYYHRKQFPHLEFLDALTFCKTAVIMCTKLITYMGILKGTDVLATEFVQHATLTVKMVKEACDVCESLNSPRTMPNADAQPISKVAVFIVDASYERCILSFGSITKGVWSLVEKNVNGFDNFIGGNQECNEQNKEQGSNKKSFRCIINTGEMRRGKKDNRTMPNEREKLQKLAYVAVKEQTGIDQSDLKVFAARVVYSLSKAKMSCRLYMMRCINDVCLKYVRGAQIKWIPVKDALSSIEGPLLENVSHTYQISSTVSYFHLRPYVNAIRDYLPWKCFTNSDIISKPFESAQHNKGQISVASDHQECRAQYRKRKSKKKESISPKTQCLNTELCKSKSDIGEDSIDNSRAIKVHSAGDPFSAQHTIKHSENSISKPSSHIEVESITTGSSMSTSKDGEDAFEASGQFLRQYSPPAVPTFSAAAADHFPSQRVLKHSGKSIRKPLSDIEVESVADGKLMSATNDEEDACKASGQVLDQCSPPAEHTFGAAATAAADPFPSQHTLNHSEKSIHKPSSHFEVQSTTTGKLMSTTKVGEDACKASGQFLGQYSPLAEHTFDAATAAADPFPSQHTLKHSEKSIHKPLSHVEIQSTTTGKLMSTTKDGEDACKASGQFLDQYSPPAEHTFSPAAADPFPSKHTLKHSGNSIHSPLSQIEVQSTATGKLMSTTKDGEDVCKASKQFLGQYSPPAENTFSAAAADPFPLQLTLKHSENSIHKSSAHSEVQSTASGKLMSTTKDGDVACKASGHFLQQYSPPAEHTFSAAAADLFLSMRTLKHSEKSIHTPSSHIEVQSTANGKFMSTTKDGEDACKASRQFLDQCLPLAEHTFSATKQLSSTLDCNLHNARDMEQDRLEQNMVNRMDQSKEKSDSRCHVSVTSKKDICHTEVGANAVDKIFHAQSKKTHFTPFQSSEQIQEEGNNLYVEEPTVKGLKFFEQHLRKKQKFNSSNSFTTASIESSQNSKLDPFLNSSIIIDPDKMHSPTVLTIINSFNKQIEQRVANYKLENEQLHQKIDSLYKFVQERFAEATNVCEEELSNTTIDKLELALRSLANNQDTGLMKMNRELLSQYLSVADELETEVNKSFEKLSVATQESFTTFIKLHDWPTLLTMRDSNINQLICDVQEVTSECLTCKTMSDHISKLQEAHEKTKKIQQWYESCPSIIMELQNFKDRAKYHWKALNKVASWSVEETMDIKKEKPESADLAALYCNRFQNLDYRLVQALEEWDHFKKELLNTVPELKSLLQIIK